MLRRSHCQWAAVLAALFVNVHVAASAEPLHQRIDRLIEGQPGFQGKAAQLASDAEFLRRIYLDLIGTIPSTDEARAFLENASPKKREELIDKLLASPEHARHLAHVFDTMLMERRAGKRIPEADWREFLRQSFAQNKPWDQLAREILLADGLEPKLRPAARFYLDREGEPHLLTKDIGRLFLGMNFQCNQCHDNPVVRSYKQDHYFGIFAFFNRSFLFTDPKNKLVVFAEKGEGEATFQSVFDATKTTKTAAPRMPGRPPLKEPEFKKGEEYTVKPAKNVRPVPKFSRRQQLADQITAPENVAFRRNIANRLWAHLMGRGLVHPLEYDHPDNPPAHPAVLDLLVEEVLAHKYDVRYLLRELALTRTYQRSSLMPAGVEDVAAETFAVANLKPLSPEQLGFAIMQATGVTDIEKQALGAKLNEAALYPRLARNMATFSNVFSKGAGEPEGEDFEVTIDQTLFMTNGPVVRSWLKPRAGNLTDRLLKLDEADKLSDELYLTVFTRRPDADEVKAVAAYLKPRADRAEAVQEIIWALLASSEFRFR
ncbi:MAG: DUF1549 domain-containing protein [Gemmataceae bacterium]